MSLFQFKVSSLKRLNNTLDQSDESISSLNSKPSRIIPKSTDQDDSLKVSQFFIDEAGLWDNVDKDISKLVQNTKGAKDDSNLSRDDVILESPQKEKKFQKDPIEENDLHEEFQKNKDISNIEGQEEEIQSDATLDISTNSNQKIDADDFELNDFEHIIDSGNEANFDLGIEINNSDTENPKSPTFEVSYKSQPKKFSNEKEICKSKEILDSVNNESKTCSLLNDCSKKKIVSLGLGDETNDWLQEILGNEAFSNITMDTPEQRLENNLKFLNKSYIEILEKVMTAFENLPTDMLEKFPDFNPDVFLTLRTTRRKIKAVIIKTENFIKRKNANLGTPDNLNNMYSFDETRFSNQIEQDNVSQKDINSSFQDLNSSFTDSTISKNAGGVFSFKQPSKLVNTSNSETNDTVKPSGLNVSKLSTPLNTNHLTKLSSSLGQLPNNISPLNSISKQQSNTEQQIIDYTDLLYKTPAKESSNKTPAGKFHTNMRNDGSSGEFDGLNFPHSKELLEKFHSKFGLRSFRPNQLQVINAALLGFDCFVLMPTGGGKSLCYQLPALVSEGVTVVISPLRSLILDQVSKLLTLDIPAASLSGELSESESDSVYRDLNQPKPPIKLLYVTPEKVGVSNNLRNCLLGLYKRDKLARFVIDEAHCVSQWGHDFRPDYKKLRELRENFPRVNIMALTATATPRVRTDILHQLKVQNPKWFLSSFNRSNLTYSVKEKKGKTTLKEIANLILNDFRKDSGVIYCFSRKECEDVAKDLKEFGIAAIPYHAGLNDKERTRTQNLWMNDRVKVVCATIAFGMGIDKLDVRYVIHYSLPKSIEGYYQESGRAGRDGEKATCILFYSYRDKNRMLKLINMDSTVSNQAAKKVHIENLCRVVAFAENKTDCRRSLQLEYFGEKFDRKHCLDNRSTACDNCLQRGNFESIDVTKESRAIVSTVKEVCGSDDQRYNNYTMLHFVEVFKGSLLKKVLSEKHDRLPLYGMGKTWQKSDIERLFRKLIMEEFLKERLLVKEDGITFAYVKFGRRGEELLKGNIKILFDVKKRKGSTAGQNVHVKPEDKVDPAFVEIQEKCYSDLLEAIHKIASSINCNPNAIMNVQALRAMSLNLPETAEEMLSINHVTTANFEKYGSVLLDITKKYALEKKALQIMDTSEENIFFDEPSSSKGNNDSPYFETDVTFQNKGGEGKKRKKGNNFRRGQYFKKWKGGGNSNKSNSSKSKAAGGKSYTKSNSTNGSGVTTVPGAKFSTLMELPTSKDRGFARPKVVLKNL